MTPTKSWSAKFATRKPRKSPSNSALTGHLVFTTVHANNVTDVIGRFINMGVEPYNFVSALNCIMAQRLVRVICENCKKQVHYTPEVLKESALDPAEWSSVPFYEGQGCLECSGSGYRGRTRDYRAPRSFRPHSRDDHQSPPHFGNQARRKGRGHDVLARFGSSKKFARA